MSTTDWTRITSDESTVIRIIDEYLYVRTMGGPDREEWKAGRLYDEESLFWIMIERYRLSDLTDHGTVLYLAEEVGDSYDATASHWTKIAMILRQMSDEDLASLSLITQHAHGG